MDVKKSLLGSLDEVLDKMAFMFFDELSEEEFENPDYKYVTFVRFSGMINGTLNILINEAAAKVIARNLLGIRDDDELYDDTLLDALKEFTNLVMGRTMTLLNPGGSFDMHVPLLVEKPSDPEEGETTIRVNGALDDTPIQVVMHYKAA